MDEQIATAAVARTRCATHFGNRSLGVAGYRWSGVENLLRDLKPDFPIDKDAFPFASVKQGILDRQIPCRIFSLSFSGELSYEINVPAGYVADLFTPVIDIRFRNHGDRYRSWVLPI